MNNHIDTNIQVKGFWSGSKFVFYWLINAIVSSLIATGNTGGKALAVLDTNLDSLQHLANAGKNKAELIDLETKYETETQLKRIKNPNPPSENTESTLDTNSEATS